MSNPFSATDLATLFLLERRNQVFLFDQAGRTSQERRSAFRLGLTFTFCLGILVVLLANHRDTLQLLSRGHSATAVLVAKRVDVDEGTNSYYLKYRFTAGGQLITAEKKTHASVFQASSVGDVEPVLYEAGKPEHCLVGEQIAGSAKDKRVLLGWTLVSVIVLGFMLAVHLEDRQLRTGGVVLKGLLVTAKFLSGGEDPDEVEVHYEFESPFGNKLHAQSKGTARRSNFSDLSLSILNHKPVAVAVLYLSDRRFALL